MTQLLVSIIIFIICPVIIFYLDVQLMDRIFKWEKKGNSDILFSNIIKGLLLIFPSIFQYISSIIKSANEEYTNIRKLYRFCILPMITLSLLFLCVGFLSYPLGNEENYVKLTTIEMLPPIIYFITSFVVVIVTGIIVPGFYIQNTKNELTIKIYYILILVENIPNEGNNYFIDYVTSNLLHKGKPYKNYMDHNSKIKLSEVKYIPQENDDSIVAILFSILGRDILDHGYPSYQYFYGYGGKGVVITIWS